MKTTKEIKQEQAEVDKHFKRMVFGVLAKAALIIALVIGANYGLSLYDLTPIPTETLLTIGGVFYLWLCLISVKVYGDRPHVILEEMGIKL